MGAVDGRCRSRLGSARPADVTLHQRNRAGRAARRLRARQRPGAHHRVLRRARHDEAHANHRHPPRSVARHDTAAGRSRARLLRQFRPHRVHRGGSARIRACGRRDGAARSGTGRRQLRQQRPARSADEAGRRQRRPARRVGDRCDARRDAAAAAGGLHARGASGVSGRRLADADVVVPRDRGQPGTRPVPAVGHQ